MAAQNEEACSGSIGPAIRPGDAERAPTEEAWRAPGDAQSIREALHDGPAQDLAAARLSLDLLAAGLIAPDEAMPRIERAVASAIGHLRSLMDRLGAMSDPGRGRP